MAFVEFRSLNSKADHLVNWGLVSSIHEDMDASQVLYQNHLESALRFLIWFFMDFAIHLRPDVLKVNVIIKPSVLYLVTRMWRQHSICMCIPISAKRKNVLTV